MNRGSIAAVCVLLFLGNVRAQDPERHTPEYQSLEAALWLLNAGAVAEDLQVIKAFLHAENDPKLTLVEAHARRIIASGKFHEAAFNTFGGDAARQFAARYRIVSGGDFGYALLAPKWEIRGNTAAPTAGDAAILGRNEVVLPRLINQRGIWKR